MACGDAYVKTFAVTSDGETIDSPGTATVLNYERWRAVAARMWELMHASLMVLGEEESKRVTSGKLLWEDSKWNTFIGEAGSPDGTLYKRLQKFHGGIWQSFDDWPEISWSNDISEVRNLCRDIACTWEQIDTAIVAYDPSKAPPKPGAEKPGAGKMGKLDVGEWINTVVAVGIIGAIAYGAYKLMAIDAKSNEGGD